MPAQPFSRFFHHTAIAKLGNPTEVGGEDGGSDNRKKSREKRGKAPLMLFCPQVENVLFLTEKVACVPFFYDGKV